MHDLRKFQLIGMVHLPPLPGSPGFRSPIAGRRARRAASTRQGALADIVDHAIGAATLLHKAGFDAIMVENYGDHPFFGDTVPPETVASLAIVVARLAEAVACPIGVNVLRNDARSALAIASVAGAGFVRVNVHCGVVATDQGLLTGAASQTIRERERLGASVQICADVHVKHAVPISQPDLAQAASDTAYRALADCLIVSGTGTGKATEPRDIQVVRQAVPDRPIWVGSGVTAASARDLLGIADGLIVGTCLKRGGKTANALDGDRVKEFVRAARGK